MDCCHRFDETFVASNYNAQGHGTPPNQGSSHNGSFVNTKEPTSTSGQATALIKTHDQPHAYAQDLHIPLDLDSQAWFVDSGASHHLTSNKSFLHNSFPYEGKNRVHIGNGQGLAIESIGSSQFASKLVPNSV